MAKRVAGVGAVVQDADGRLLVVRRGRPPHAGAWSIPGGRVEPGEDAVAAVVREVAEETGLVVLAGELLGIVEFPGPDGTVFAVRDYRCVAVGGELLAGDDAAEVAWVTAAELAARPTTPDLAEILASWGVRLKPFPGPGPGGFRP